MKKSTLAVFATLTTLVVLFQNCGQHRTLDTDQSSATLPLKSSLESVMMDAKSEAGFLASSTSSVDNCPEILQVRNSAADASSLLQNCFDRATGKTLELAAGVYNLKKRVRIQGPIRIRTQGTGTNPIRCSSNDANCATFKAANNDDYTNNQSDRGLFLIRGSNVHLQSLIFDGDQKNRFSSRLASACRAGENGSGTLVNFDAASSSIRGSVFKRAICGSSLTVGRNDILIEQNRFEENGLNSETGLWADGLTMGEVQSATIQDNLFHNNTDVHMVMGGCTNCRVLRNSFSHDSNVHQASFAALVLHRWHTGQSGSYTGTLVEGNTIDCGPSFLCGHALALGADAWSVGLSAFGGTIRSNTISNAIIGFQIDELIGGVEIHDLRILTYASGDLACHNSSVRLPAAAVNVAPNSLRHLNASSKAAIESAIASFPASASTSVDHDFCVPSPGQSNVKKGAPKTTTPEPPQSSDPVRSFISLMYQSILGRPADPGGLDYWTQTYKVYKMTCTSFAREMLKSPEFKALNQNRSNVEKTTALYRGILLREPDKGGLDFWSSWLGKGLSFEQLQTIFLDSPEFRDGLCKGKYSLTP